MHPTDEPNEELYKQWQEDPSNWRLGFLYINPKDKRLFISKRYGIGWTFNLANPMAIIIMLAIVLIGVLISVYL
jgi:uncharacterized membrane protein